MMLWTGRMSGEIDYSAAQLNNSLPFDQRMWAEDIKASITWTNGLARAGLLSLDETETIVTGLQTIAHEFEKGAFVFHANDEDIHTAVERRLIEIAGPVGGKLHTGRSRNDQVSTDFRLWVINAIENTQKLLKNLQSTLIKRARQDMGIVLPGYTHTQQAQPIMLSHWWLSHFWALERDRQRFKHLLEETKVLPLGCGALAGTSFPIDRTYLSNELGFFSPSANSLDAISDRDFAVEFLFCATLTADHLSRLAEALILYSTLEYGFMVMADEYSTGSSLMPQKKNPDMLELVRGKTGTLIGRLTGLLCTIKGTSSAYDKDLQEDKPAVFETADTIALLLAVTNGVVETLTVNSKRMRAAIDPMTLATDLADYLVLKGIPFRQAHHAIGAAVKKSEELEIKLRDLPLDEWQTIHPAFKADLFEVFDIDRSISRRAAIGGTAPEAVIKQLEKAQKLLR
jgi:argininosuccinate lyase